ncbi:alpha/beta fold hydrolase [Thalassospira marina]|uniref:Alpha/beta hydrolase n=1 Tax=Thalassospira marina TaxID=2048283 RepID=A0A2N3L047_9PROT|nr:alpha/beta hydrolase [Thalassospira marina]PKR56191.1 alpha/beta hydrolase [Thalassospira marina]
MKSNLVKVAATLAVLAFTSGSALAQSAVDMIKPASIQAKNVVLVHGAWADGSSWAKVIPILQKAGLHVTAVQNRLTSLKDSDEDVRRALAQQDGPTVLAGHSWSGTAISDVGNAKNVSALVYVAARAPEAGEDFVALQKTFPDTPVRAGVEKFDGFTKVSEDAFLKYFANGIGKDEARVYYAVQQPTAASLFGERTTDTAWKSKPVFYAVSAEDKTISPEFEAFLAKRMGAQTITLDAGHLSMVSHPQEIADLILKAAGRK